MKKQHSKEFKKDEGKDYLNHKDLGFATRAKNLGTSRTAISSWTKEAREHNRDQLTGGAGTDENDETKEIARLRKELRETKDTLEILKKAIDILGN